MKKYFLYLVIFLFIVSCKNVSPLCEDTSFTYNTEVKPIIDANCNTMGCHSQGSVNGDYTSYEGLESSFDGSFEDRVFNKKDMPKGSLLNFEDLATLQCWMEKGFKE